MNHPAFDLPWEIKEDVLGNVEIHQTVGKYKIAHMFGNALYARPNAEFILHAVNTHEKAMKLLSDFYKTGNYSALREALHGDPELTSLLKGN